MTHLHLTRLHLTRNRSLALIALLALPLVASAQGGFSGAGRYEISNLKSGKVLDLDRNDQTTVIQFSSRGTDNQTWQFEPADSGFFYIRNMMNGYALEAAGRNNSAPVRGVPFNGSPNQQWRIENGKDGNALIVNRSGKGLDIPDGTDRDGVRVQVYDVNGDSNQRFQFRRASGGGGRNWGGGNGGWRGNQGNNQGGNWGNNNQQGSTLTCSSNDGSRVYCNANVNGGVRMTRQISGSPCREGETWGYDNRGVWVDRGCRAEFQTGVGGNNNNGRGWGSGRNNNRATTITCVSDRGRRVYCAADGNADVRLVRQTGNQACVEGSTWGKDNRGIWVDRGCAGEFEVRR